MGFVLEKTPHLLIVHPGGALDRLLQRQLVRVSERQNEVMNVALLELFAERKNIVGPADGVVRQKRDVAERGVVAHRFGQSDAVGHF